MRISNSLLVWSEQSSGLVILIATYSHHSLFAAAVSEVSTQLGALIGVKGSRQTKSSFDHLDCARNLAMHLKLYEIFTDG